MSNPFVIAIPYRSQWDEDADNPATADDERNTSCGPACCAMLAEWQGNDQPISFFSVAGSSGLTTADHLVQNLGKAGLAAVAIGLGIGEPAPDGAICLNWYGGFERSSVQDTGYTGWHWMIKLYEDAQRVLCHDPDWWGERRSEGAYREFTFAEWEAAFIPYPGDSFKTAVILTGG